MAAIIDSIRKLAGGITILAIPHQPTMVKAAHLVYRLEHGLLEGWSITLRHTALAGGIRPGTVSCELVFREGQSPEP